MKKKFIQFLKREGVYEKFMRNFNNDPEHSADGIDKYCEIIDPPYYLLHAFYWNETLEHKNKEKFWDQIEEKWIAYIEENKKVLQFMPTDKETEEACYKYEEEQTLDRPTIYCYEDFMAGAKWMKEYITKGIS